jgi:hypothetical protein
VPVVCVRIIGHDAKAVLALNYRRGFQRIYTLLSLAWVLAAIWVIRPDQASFWSEPDYDALIKKYGGVIEVAPSQVKPLSAPDYSAIAEQVRKESREKAERGPWEKYANQAPARQNDDASAWKPVQEPKRVVDFNGVRHEFPGDATDDEIRKALEKDQAEQKLHREKQSSKPTQPEQELHIVKSDPLPPRMGKYSAADIQAEAPPQPRSHMGKGAWLSSVLFFPPAMGYLALFLAVPWIARGFNGKSQDKRSVDGPESR